MFAYSFKNFPLCLCFSIQNRDRLELFALHKQAVTGDAPASLPSSATGPEKAKYQSWRSKSGLSVAEAMQLYLQESDRQVRVYGTTALPQTPLTTPNSTPGNNNNTPRGLAAIPLLCAAASESRPAYLRRLGQTPLESAWWGRQEPLCASPNTLASLPESLVIMMARLIEYVSLSSSTRALQAFLWPVHNCLLSTWMGVILLSTIMEYAWAMLRTIVWGARRTGITLASVWNERIPMVSQSISSLCESHQALSCRLVGLIFLPIPTTTNVLQQSSLTLATVIYLVLLSMTWWYWFLVVPWLVACLLGTALASGTCFGLIDLAGM